MMGGLVLITGIVVTVCVCFSSRRCLCRQGSRTVNSNSSAERGGNQTTHTRRHFVRRTDRVSHGDSPPSSSLPPVEGPATDFPFQVILPRYTEPSAPPPYNRHEVIELQRLPSSPPPPYSSNDPNPSFVSLGDINVPSIPGEATHRFWIILDVDMWNYWFEIFLCEFRRKWCLWLSSIRWIYFVCNSYSSSVITVCFYLGEDYPTVWTFDYTEIQN